MSDFQEGDIFFWRWKDENRQNGAPFGDYHCFSQIAIARGGTLRDTYWSSEIDCRRISSEECTLDYKGNINEMRIIAPYEIPYYEPDDIVDTRHANNTSAPVYLKPGATKSATAMRAHLTRLVEDAERDIDFTQRRLERLQEQRVLIESGRLEDVCF